MWCWPQWCVKPGFLSWVLISCCVLSAVPVACRLTAHAQMLPNHLEVSYQVNAFIYLWPPMEMFYPYLFDAGYMLRHLKPHFKRTRVSKSQKARKVRCSLGWQRNKPYHKQRVFGTPSVPAALLV